MPGDVGDRQAVRRSLLLKLYEMAEGELSPARAQYLNAGEQIGLDQPQTDAAVRYLDARGWVERPQAMPYVLFTVRGIDEAERLLDLNSASAEEYVTPGEAATIQLQLAEVRAAVAASEDLNPDLRKDIISQVLTVEAQLQSPRPRRRLVSVALGVLRFLVVSAGQELVGSAAWAASLQAVRALGG